jgi:histidinol-phosphate aminotransferase
VKKQLTVPVQISSYPDPAASELKKAIIEFWRGRAQLKTSNIKVGLGSVELLQNINKAVFDPGDIALGIAPQFTDYISEVEILGGIYEYVPLGLDKDYKFSLDNFLNAMDRKYKLYYIDNPNNPTGQIISLSSIEAILKKAAGFDAVVLVDEAYGDFMDLDKSAVTLANKYDNLLVTKSFSKGLGIAGARVGYLVASEEFCEQYSKVAVPFASTPGLVLAAAALSDPEFILNCRKWIKERKLAVADAIKKMRYFYTDFEVPIIGILHPDENVDIYEELKKRGIITDRGFLTLGNNFTRLRVPADGNDRVIAAIKDIESTI